MRTIGRKSTIVWILIVLCLSLLPAGRADAQGDGPHNLPLIPINTNIFTPQVLVLSGNFIPAGTAVVPGASVDVVAVPITYIRTFALGSHFGRLFAVLPVSTLDASADVFDPIQGKYRFIDRGRSGIMDPMVTLHIGLAGAPALKLGEFMKHPKSFQMVAIAGVGMPFGTYDSSRLINLGTNRWTIRTGHRDGLSVRREEAHGAGDEQQPLLLHEEQRCSKPRLPAAGPPLRDGEPPDPQLHAEVLGVARRPLPVPAARSPPMACRTTAGRTRWAAGSRSATRSPPTSGSGRRSTRCSSSPATPRRRCSGSRSPTRSDVRKVRFYGEE